MPFSVACAAMLNCLLLDKSFTVPQSEGLQGGFLTVISVKLFPHMVYKALRDPKGWKVLYKCKLLLLLCMNHCQVLN